MFCKENHIFQYFRFWLKNADIVKICPKTMQGQNYVNSISEFFEYSFSYPLGFIFGKSICLREQAVAKAENGVMTGNVVE